MNQQSIGKYRWTVCAMLFFATTVNYLDRQVLSLLAPDLSKQFGWTNSDYANITAVFQFVYAISMLFAGRIVDRLGTKQAFILAITVWSIGAILHAFSIPMGAGLNAILGAVGIAAVPVSVAGFMIARAILAIGEAGNFPAAIKATAEYFPEARALVRDRHFQFRRQYRRGAGADQRAVDRRAVGLAGGVHRDRRDRFHLDGHVAGAVREAGAAKAPEQRGAGVHQQ